MDAVTAVDRVWRGMPSAQASQPRAGVREIRRLCHASLLPGHMPRGLHGCRSLPCVICRSFAVLYGQNQATAPATPPEVVGAQR
jgi:hypothetical protein